MASPPPTSSRQHVAYRPAICSIGYRSALPVEGGTAVPLGHTIVMHRSTLLSGVVADGFHRDRQERQPASPRASVFALADRQHLSRQST